MKLLFASLLLTTLLFSCAGSADNKVPELANELCGCFDGMQKSFSPEIIQLFKTVAKAKDPEAALIQGMAQLKPGEAKKLTEALASMGDKDSPVFKCMEAFDGKHAKETTADRLALTEKLLAAMQQYESCATGAAIVNLGLRKQKKLADK